MKKTNYTLIKKSEAQEIVYIDYDKISGFEIRPKNKVKYEGVVVNQLILIKPSFVEKLLVRKTKRKLEQYLKYIISIMEDGDNNDEESVAYALDSVERYRVIVKNKYRVYLDNKYYQLLMKKIDLIEQQLSKKLYLLSHNIDEPEIKSTRRR